MVILHRLSTSLSGTQGVILHDKKVICHTLELPWRFNTPNSSSIPAGVYPTFRGHSEKFGSCFYLGSVPGRVGILIHPGNSIKDTKGCILVGLDTSDFHLVNSRLAMSRLVKSLPFEFDLIVKENY